MSANLSEEQLRILRHMLGIDDRRRPDLNPYRDYYCANPGDAELVDLARLGAVRRYAERDGYHWYCTTDAGRAAALDSARQRRKSKSARVYSRFLDVRDSHPDLTFKTFLTHPSFADTRRYA